MEVFRSFFVKMDRNYWIENRHMIEGHHLYHNAQVVEMYNKVFGEVSGPP